jgi:aldehyde dehydrogenase (NAD+)
LIAKNHLEGSTGSAIKGQQSEEVSMVNQILERQKAFFKTGATRPLVFRLNQLSKLKRAIETYESDLMTALALDLRKPAFESYATEIGFVLSSIGTIEKNLEKWMRDTTVKTPIFQPMSKGFIRKEPYGTVLIMAPFNYPFQLAIEPLIGAIAAGNTAVVKPSEFAVHTEAVLKRMIESTFEPGYVQIVTGDRAVAEALIHAPFDYIFFTGSVPVGKAVMRAASENLVPVTLELGGKSPAIVHEDADLEVAAKRIAWGKFMNAGQICIAPDYVYVHKSVEKALIEKLTEAVLDFYGHFPAKSPDYCRIINQKHFDRLVGLIDHDKVVFGGQYDAEDLFIAPTIMQNVSWRDVVMADEIFGPILPVLTYERLDDALDQIQAHPKPLALYIFSESETVQSHVIDSVSFGGGCINDTISHVSAAQLPFGGVGTSGMGRYHGESSFLTFSHEKSILKKSTKHDLPLIYPPYKNRLKWVKKLMK